MTVLLIYINSYSFKVLCQSSLKFIYRFLFRRLSTFELCASGIVPALLGLLDVVESRPASFATVIFKEVRIQIMRVFGILGFVSDIPSMDWLIWEREVEQ